MLHLLNAKTMEKFPKVNIGICLTIGPIDMSHHLLLQNNSMTRASVWQLPGEKSSVCNRDHVARFSIG